MDPDVAAFEHENPEANNGVVKFGLLETPADPPSTLSSETVCIHPVGTVVSTKSFNPGERISR
jgi:hypothetical protein